MAIKYRINYTDQEGIEHDCTISDVNYVGSETDISGAITWSLAESKDVGDAIRGSGLTINLDADVDLTFDDLYSEEEKTFSVQYTRDSVISFNGWLTSDGIYQDYVADKWVISIDCVDGLGYLSDLSYVDSNGFTFTGNQTLLEIIVNCLNRTGVSQNINTNIDIYYTGLATTLDVLDNVYFNADRFIKDDGETIMSCEEVLTDVLKPFKATITSLDGEWYIYKLNQLYVDDTPTFFRYDSDGVALAPTTKTVDFSSSLGSQIDGYYPHHSGGNQSIRNNKSLGAYRINYKYGLVKSLLSNIFLENVGGVIDDWTINSFTNLTFNASDLGVDIETIADGSDVKNMTSDVITLSAGDLLSYTYKYKVIENNKVGGLIDPGETQYKIVLTDGIITYYWNTTDWAAFDVMLTSPIGNLGTITTQTVNLTALPIAGDITFEIWTSVKDPLATSTSVVHLQEVSISPSSAGNEANIKGEFHTFQREDKPSTKIEDPERVNNGDNPSDIYYGTIYKTDGTTPTETWFRKGKTEEVVLLQIMGEETMRLKANVSKEFSGDIYGYIPHYSIVTINGLTGLYVFIEYNYDTASNITNCKLREVFGSELTDINYELTLDYGNVVRPTIKG